ncbi:MAG: Ger(x)C family spore germination protein [Clostridia bacterium]|nr:Ger(x)C family spore germination protein [Clostridia bacterium]
MKKIFKNFLLLILLLITLFNLTGCYDARGIEELAYVIAIGLDVSEDNELELTLQFATSGGNDSSGSSSNSSQLTSTTMTSIKCASINSGIASINSHISKKVNLSHCQKIIVSEKLAYLGLSEFLDTFANNIELRTDCSIVISKCSAKDYLKNVKPSLETLTARYYEASLNSTQYTGYTVDVNLSEFYSNVKDSYSQAYAILGGINNTSSKNNAQLNADYTAGESPIEDKDVIENLGIAVFHGDKLVGELTGLDSICHLIVNNDLDSCTLSIPSPFEDEKYLDLSITTEKKAKCSVTQINSSPLITVNVYLIGYGLSLNDDTSYNSAESLKLVENYAEKYIKSQIKDYLYKTSKKYNADICGFGRYAVTDYLTLDEWYKSNWLENYKDSFFDVNVDLIMKSGNMFART